MIGCTVALAGNPNVGKSSVFNALTGLHQHTGNWSGKTVSLAEGSFSSGKRVWRAVDLPGTYSLETHSEEERVAREFLSCGQAEVVVVICDATNLRRSLHLVLQCLAVTGNVIVCVNLMDEAKRQGITLDLEALGHALNVPIMGCSAHQKRSLRPLLDLLESYPLLSLAPRPALSPEAIAREAERLAALTVSYRDSQQERKLSKSDQFLTGTLPGLFVFLAGLTLTLWVTILGANVISDLLSTALRPVTAWLNSLLAAAPVWLRGVLLDGLWRVAGWVVSVMLPPMAVFFPLFTLLEDAGVLPRIAYALDTPFHRCGACGKQALTACMSLGCNAAGVVGCRIVDSPRERLLAMLTASLMPCSGRFPIITALTVMFFTPSGWLGSAVTALSLTGLFLLSVGFTFLSTKLLDSSLLRGTPGAFTLELPPYRRPQIGQVLLRSLLDRTVFVLGRAVTAAAPAGVLIWALANLSLGDQSLLGHLSGLLDPFGRIMGMDGVTLLAFILGLPANEIVLPLVLMGYLSAGTLPDLAAPEMFHAVLVANGWTWQTALCAAVFTLAHWPCATTILSIYRETGDRKWTAVGVALPTMVGVLSCVLLHTILTALTALF